MKKFFIVALAAIGMTACMQDAVVETPHGGAIAFENAFVDNATRAAEVVTTTNLDKFQVWGYVKAPSGVLFDNTTVTRSGNVWSYGDLQYWAPDQQYYFAAVAPSTATNWSLAMESAVGDSRVLTFANDGNTDLIYAWENRRSNPTGQANDVVAFKFDHLLSKVMLSFKNAFPTDNVSVVLSDIALATPKNATIDLAASTWAWDIADDDEYVTDLDFDVYTLDKGVSVSSPEYFIIPAECEISFTIDVIVGGQNVYNGIKTATLPADAFEMGHAYNLSAEINPGILDFDEIVFTVDKVEEWNEPATDHYVDAYKDETGANYYVATAEGLAQVGEEINAGTFNGTVNLTGDIDLNDLVVMRSAVESNWVPVGTPETPFTGTFDGNGYTIKNLTLVESEAKEGKAFIGFFGYAKNVTIKNVTFENVYVNIPCLDIDHSQGHIGAVVGSLEGTSTVENVTVRGDIFVEATPTANGASRVGVVAGGNLGNGKVTMKNVHVEANEGSYLRANNNTGSLAGQLMGNNLFVDCSSNIDVTVNKFFAGGIIGIAGSNDTFINCHTSGDIAVIAGREGRHNDEYRVGGIAGGWADGPKNVCTLRNCTYSGKVSGKNSDGAEANPLDYAGYVGRGYTLKNCAGSKVVIDGVEYVQKSNDEYGSYDVYRNEIKTAEEFRAFAASVNDGNSYEGQTVVLAADIDLNNEEWEPIGSATQDHGFMGDFYGNGHTIKNLKITELLPDEDGYVYAGLFGVTEGTADKNNYIGGFSIENVHIDCEGSIVAAAIAYPYYTIVDDITVKGKITIKGTDYTAGVLAYTRRCVKASNLVIAGESGSVIEGGYTIGGVISDIQTNGGLTAEYSNFSASGLTIKGDMHVGGISGIIARQTLDGATVENVVIDCDDNRKGIVSGSLGEKSTLINVSYDNVTGATHVIGATYDDASPVIEVDGVYMGVSTVADTDELQDAINAGQSVIYLARNTVFEGTVYMKSNVTIVGLEGSTMHNINLNGAKNVTLKNINFDAANAAPCADYNGNYKMYANIMTGMWGVTPSNKLGAHNLVIDGCSFTGNFKATKPGTAIAFADQNRTSGYSGNITIKNCIFDTVVDAGGYDIYGFYVGDEANGYGDFVIENNTFKSTRVGGGGTIGLFSYCSNTPIVVKDNVFEKDASIDDAINLTTQSYNVSIAASNNTFAN